MTKGDFILFTKSHKNGFHESQIKKYLPLFYAEIINASLNTAFEFKPFRERLWWFFNRISDLICPICDKKERYFRNFNSGYSCYCSKKCRDISQIGLTVYRTIPKEQSNTKRKITCLKKYGVDNVAKSKLISDKTKQTNMEKYGMSTPIWFDYNKTRESMNKTFISNYGVSNPMSNPDVLEKMRKNNIHKYGVPCVSNVKEVVDKIVIKKLNKILNAANIKKENILSINEDKTLSILCVNCGEVFNIGKVLLRIRTKSKFTICTKCYPPETKGTSLGQHELTLFIKNLGFDVEERNRSIKKMELDIVIKKLNIAFEYNGVYWHNEINKPNKKYHLNKTELAKDAGYKLFHVWEDDWLYKRDIVKSMIKNILGITGTKLNGRNCTISEIPQKEASIFLDKNHIQGDVYSPIRLGLFHDKELVSVMTFSKVRNKSKKWEENTMELVRFCNKLNTTVRGGTSKLLNHFVNNYNYNIIGYADRSRSTGNLYERLGFELDSVSNVGYCYVVDGVRIPRTSYTKKKLVTAGFTGDTEHDIMLNRGIYRIYDCGNFVYKLKNEHQS